jgi:molybdopterin synthase catalytic subunit
MAVRVQQADFDVGAELERLTNGNKRIGGLAVFVGLVREMHVRDGYHRDRVDALTLEHYPGMTEQALEEIEAEAGRRWPLEATLIVHRHGRLEAGDRIVLVAVGSPHREAAFEACEFLVDWLKTKAPFWKLEETPAGEKWVGAHVEDDQAAARWDKKQERKIPSD